MVTPVVCLIPPDNILNHLEASLRPVWLRFNLYDPRIHLPLHTLPGLREVPLAKRALAEVALNLPPVALCSRPDGIQIEKQLVVLNIEKSKELLALRHELQAKLPGRPLLGFFGDRSWDCRIVLARVPGRNIEAVAAAIRALNLTLDTPVPGVTMRDFVNRDERFPFANM